MLLHVVFVNYRPFEDSSGIHIFFLANELQRLGIRCTVCVPWKTSSVTSFGKPLFKTINYPAAFLATCLRILKKDNEQVIVHAWTPRENVRRLTLFLAKQLSVPYLVHLEDNEEDIIASHFQMPYQDVARLPGYRFWKFPLLINPRHYRKFLANASGMTCIMESLENFAPSGVPALTFWPACEPEFFAIPEEPDQNIRQALGITAEEFVITYTGNVHQANTKEVGNLYLAVGLLNKQGKRVRLLRTGSDYMPMSEEAIRAGNIYALEMGRKPPAELIQFVRAADILVQPGQPCSFDEFRFPSKLPMYFASGRPVVLPRINIGAHVEDGVECLHLTDGSPEDIASKIGVLIEDHDLARKIGASGREFARTNFSWEKTSQNVVRFYESILENRVSAS